MAEENQKWYVLRAISGKEQKVKEVLDAAIKVTPLGNYVSQVLIPVEKVASVRNGKKVEKERILYSGYVFIKAQLTGEVIYELRNTTNVIDFLRGRAKGSAPEALHESEVMRMLGVADDLRTSQEDADGGFIIGEAVKVTDGAFNGFSGVVKEVFPEKRKVRVQVTVFERPTDLDLDNSQVERV